MFLFKTVQLSKGLPLQGLALLCSDTWYLHYSLPLLAIPFLCALCSWGSHPTLWPPLLKIQFPHVHVSPTFKRNSGRLASDQGMSPLLSMLPGMPMRDEGNSVLYILRRHQGPRSPGFAGRGGERPEFRSTTLTSAPASPSSVSQPEFWLQQMHLLFHFLPALSQHPSHGFVTKSTFFQTCLSCHVNQGKFLGIVSKLLSGGIGSSIYVPRKSKHREYRA